MPKTYTRESKNSKAIMNLYEWCRTSCHFLLAKNSLMVDQRDDSSKPFTENWVGKRKKIVLILTTAKKKFFLGIKLFLFFKVES